MPYRDAPPRCPPLHARWTDAFVYVLAPLLVPASLLRDAVVALCISRLPLPVSVDAVIARLTHEAPRDVERVVLFAYTIASGPEEVRHVLVLRFAAERVVVAGRFGPTVDDATLVHRHLDACGLPVRERAYGTSSLGLVLALPGALVVAVVLALLLGPIGGLVGLALLPLSTALAVAAGARADRWWERAVPR